MRLFLRRLVGIWSYLAASIAATVIAGSVAWAANLPLFSGPSTNEPGQLNATVNQLISNINTGVSGLIGFSAGPVSSIATTVVQPFVTSTIPTGQLVSAGQGLRVTCGGVTQANTDTKTVSLTVGTATVTSTAIAIPSVSWSLDLLWQPATTPVTANNVWIGHAFTSTVTGASSSVTVNGGNDTNANDNIANQGIPVKCSYVQGTSAVDVTMETFTIEQVK